MTKKELFEQLKKVDDNAEIEVVYAIQNGTMLELDLQVEASKNEVLFTVCF